MVYFAGRLSRDFPPAPSSPPGCKTVSSDVLPTQQLPKPPSSPAAAVKMEDNDVDVEQCSDGEGETKADVSDVKKDVALSSEKKAKKKEKEKIKVMKSKCNCEELRYVDCYLETKELWDKFNELGTEMIITKTGR